MSRPEELLDASPRDLLDAWLGTLAILLGRVHPPGRLRVTALDHLMVGAALVQQLTADRWARVRDALVHGATVAQVADALGLDDVEVRAGLRSWADTRLARSAVTGATPAERDAVYALVDEPEAGEPR